MKARHLVFLTVTGVAVSGTATAAIQYFSYTGTRNSWTGSNWSTTSGGSYINAWGGYNEAILEGTGGTVSGGSAVNKWTFNADGYILTGGFTMGSPDTANFIINNAAHTATISGGLSYANSSNILWKDGAGKLVLGGTNSAYKLYTEQGTLEINAGSTTVANDFHVGRDSFGTATTKLGTFSINGGGLTVNGANFMMGQTVNGSNKVAQFTQTGGTVTFNGTSMNLANGGGVSQLDLSGGSFTSTSAIMVMGVRNNTTLNVSGTATVNVPEIRIFWADVTTGTGKTGAINLDGGTLTTGKIWQASGANNSTVNFNGGTLKARSANAGFLGGLTSANVKSGGAKIDTNTYDIIIAQPLLDGSGGGGLTKSNTGKLTLSGTNTYTGATAITGGTLALTGSGSIASSSSIAIAGATSTFDVSGIAAGTWTVGASQTVSGIGTLNGGSKILSVAGTLAPGNSAGDLGINLSPGGTLDLASGSVLAFELGSTSDSLTFSSVGNWLTGSGNATLSLTMLDGFSYAGTYTIFDNVTTTGFTLADISGYDETNYSANFLQSGDSYNLTFTAVPEPRAALIGGLGLIALLRRRR